MVYTLAKNSEVSTSSVIGLLFIKIMDFRLFHWYFGELVESALHTEQEINEKCLGKEICV